MDMSVYGFPLLVIAMGMFGGLGMWYVIHSVETKGKDRVRQLYAELVKEKLDVIKTALAMGHSTDDIRELDERLEKLIGTEKMLKTLKKGKLDAGQEADLKAVDLLEEMDKQAMQSTREDE